MLNYHTAVSNNVFPYSSELGIMINLLYGVYWKYHSSASRIDTRDSIQL